MQSHIRELGPGMMQQIQTVCSECRGEGQAIDPKLRCRTCNGKKVTKERKIFEVIIDKGQCFTVDVLVGEPGVRWLMSQLLGQQVLYFVFMVFFLCGGLPFLGEMCLLPEQCFLSYSMI